jgi:phosphonopyruvate decarboxylase
MTAQCLLNVLQENNIDFFCGVPDSLLNPLCNEIYQRYGYDDISHHLILHNEGGAVGYAAGYHLATGKTPCIYLQNSGIGNITNPVCSLTHPVVYGIPVLYMIGWRGKPNTSDEPQHEFQGIVTKEQLRTLDIELYHLNSETTESELRQTLKHFDQLFAIGKSAALLVDKDALSSDISGNFTNEWAIVREAAIEKIVEAANEDLIVSSTGKISRELFEVRMRAEDIHERDFLTVGSMGHDSMIALGIAQQKPVKKVWCIQGDGAFLMHMGQAAIVGSIAPSNLRHIVLNNAAHESVGGMPTVGAVIDLCSIAKACGYQRVFSVVTMDELEATLQRIASYDECVFLEIKCAMISRKDLGRPTIRPVENKEAFMKCLKVRK